MADDNSPLEKKLKRLIKLGGPISLADYFHICMSDPDHGYYQKRQVIGSGGDFITAPEISQMFGELIGVWCIDIWQQMGRPARFSLAELGPGKGTLMKDVLKAAGLVPAFLTAANVTLIETSLLMRDAQKSTLKDQPKNILWCNSISELPDQPMIVIGNEFLDVIPIRQYTKDKEIWREIGITFDEVGNFQPTLMTRILEDSILPSSQNTMPEEAIYEHSPMREAIVDDLSAMLAKNHGAALLIDYGHLYHRFGSTFQAVRNHEKISPFQMPGLADLTAHVDFASLGAIAAKNNIKVDFTSQSDFLLQLGLLQRAGRLGANADKSTQEQIQDAVNRLASPDQMGDLFKVMALYSRNLAPIGFNPKANSSGSN